MAKSRGRTAEGVKERVEALISSSPKVKYQKKWYLFANKMVTVSQSLIVVSLVFPK